MDRRRADLFVRTLFWLAFAVRWAYLNRPEVGGFLAVRSGFPLLLGVGLIASGLTVYAWSARLLADAAPIALSGPKMLLKRGPYGYVRNPLYLSIAAVLAGVSALYGAWGVSDLVRAAIVVLCVHFAVVRLEEPATRKRLGAEYDEYCRLVPRWMPRWRESVKLPPPRGMFIHKGE